MGSVRWGQGALGKSEAELETHPTDMCQCWLCLKDKNPKPKGPQVSGKLKHLHYLPLAIHCFNSSMKLSWPCTTTGEWNNYLFKQELVIYFVIFLQVLSSWKLSPHFHSRLTTPSLNCHNIQGSPLSFTVAYRDDQLMRSVLSLLTAQWEESRDEGTRYSLTAVKCWGSEKRQQ